MHDSHGLFRFRICIYVGNKLEVGYAEMYVLYACYVGSEDVGNPEDYAFSCITCILFMSA